MSSPAKKRKSKVVEDDAPDTPSASAAPAGFNAAAGAGAAGPKQVKVEGKATTASGSDEKRVAIARAAAVSNESTFTPEMLRVYYARLYPVKLMFEWLRYGDALSNGESDVFRRREWSFTLRDDIYIRFMSYATEETFHKALLDKLPFKIDIGAIYNAPPTMKDSLPRFAPESKEVVFDVDITDYDSIRMCGCKEAAVCDKCWSLMTAAILTTDAALRNDFGFENILWVFSGRRGVHCWVCDPRARTLSNDARTALIEYMSVYMGNDKNRTLNLYYPLPPSLQRAYDLLEPLFVESYIKQQGLLDSNDGRKKVLEFFEDPKVAEKVEWSVSCKTGLERWNQLVANVEKFAKSQKNPRLRSALHKLVFTYQYPRLDVNVSKNMNHLLKAPWCIHPKTGKVCVPIDPQQAELFSPNRVPTLWQLHEELNAPTEAGAPEVGGVWRRTSLKPHIEFFVSAFLKPLMATFPRERGPAKGGVEMQF